MAVSASVLLVVARRNAEGDQAAAEPAANEAENEAEDPAESALLLVHVRHTRVSAVLALHRHRMVRPVARRVGAAHLRTTLDHYHLGTGLASHWLLCHHWLTWGHHRLALGSVLRLTLSHRLRGVLWLLCDQWLLFRCHLTCGNAIVNCFVIHASLTSSIFFNYNNSSLINYSIKQN